MSQKGEDSAGRAGSSAPSARAALFLSLAPSLLLAALCLIAAWKLALGGRIIARGDLLLYFYPLRDFAAQAVREGRLPLWNPYTFMGAPFLANSQAGFFYPINIVLSWLPVEQAVSLNIVLHLLLATLTAYALGRLGLRFGRAAAFAAGAAFGLGGYLGAQVEHLNQLQVLAWMPLLVLLVIRPVADLRGALRRSAALAGVLSLQILAGHTQSLYIAGVTAGLAALACIAWPERGAWRGQMQRLTPLAVLVAGAVLAALICAAQLVPTLELSRESFRSGGLPFNEAGSFSWRPWVIARALLPTYGDPLFAEYVAYFGAAGIALAALGALSALRARRQALLPLVLLAVGFVLALGVATPLFNVLYKLLPGFGLFRAQARWLAMFTLGAALLIGAGVDTLLAGIDAQRARRWLSVCVVVFGVLAFSAWLGARISPEAEYAALPSRTVLLGWAAGAITVGAAMAAMPRMRQRGTAAGLFVTVLVVELLAASQFQPYARASDTSVLRELRPSTAHLLAERFPTTPGGSPHTRRVPPPLDSHSGRILALSGLFFDPGDKPEQELIFANALSPDELYDRLIASKHKEILSPNLSLYYRLPSVDGYDGGLLPTRRFVEFAQQFAGNASKDGRLREFLKSVPDLQWLSQMGVRHVVADKTQDVFIDGVFYDLLFTTPLAQAREISLQPYESTAIGLVFGLPNAREGETVGQLELTFSGELTQSFAISTPSNAPADGFHLQLRWDEPRTPLSARFAPGSAARGLLLRGITLIDARDTSYLSQIAYADALVRLVHSGDVKIYELIGDAAARAFVREDPLRRALIHDDSPEHVSVSFAEPLYKAGTLILRDSCYPGWVARVDDVITPIECVDILFRSVKLPAGARQIVFSYEPQSVRSGLWLSALGIGLWLALALAAWRYRAGPLSTIPNTTPSTGTR